MRVADGKIVEEIGPEENSVDGEIGHENGIMGLACLDANRLMTFGWDSLAIIWDHVTGKQLQRTVSPQEGTALGARVASSGEFAVSVGNKSLVLWDIKTAKARVVQIGYFGWDAAVSPNSKLIAAVGGTYGLGFSPDSKRLVAGSNGGRVVLLEADTGRQIMRLTGNEGAVSDAIFSPDGSTIAASDDFGNIMLWTATRPLMQAIVKVGG